MGPMAPKVKICGLTNLDDARRAAALGAWALGLIFHEPSPRACTESEALEIAAALHRRALVCGVFVNRPLDEVVAAADRIGLTMLQLHGDEGPAACAEAARRTGCRVARIRPSSRRSSPPRARDRSPTARRRTRSDLTPSVRCERGRAPLRALRRAVRSRDADAGARAARGGVGAGVGRSRLSR